jgi:hypothetical protein
MPRAHTHSPTARCAALFALMAWPVAAAGPLVLRDIHHDLSPPLRDLASRGDGGDFGAVVAGAPNLVTPQGGPIGVTPGVIFPGMTSVGAYLESDANGSVGATQYVQWTNSRYAVYSKSNGAVLLKPTSPKTLWTGFGGPCETTSAGDGIILYDKAAARWLISDHSGAPAPFLQCIAISTTSDATGSYYRYAFALTSMYPDWPKFGVWPDAYYLTSNILSLPGEQSVGAEACALDRTNMLLGNAATAQCFTTGTATVDKVLLPADLDGATPPPAGSPNYMLSLSVNRLDLFQFHVDWTTPSNSSLTGPIFIPATPFRQLCANGGACIPQPDTTDLLDSLGDRMMYRLAYRNFGDHESLVANHTVTAGPAGGVRWYEIRSPATTPEVYQQSTFAPDTNYRFVGSVAMDQVGNMMGGYIISSSTVFPGIRFSGRLVTDPLNTWQPEGIITNGGGSFPAGDHSLTDLSSMSLDPVDDCTFWYTAAYVATTGKTWSSTIASLRFGSCP